MENLEGENWQAWLKRVRDLKIQAAVAYYELQKDEPNMQAVNTFLPLLWKYLQDFRYEQIRETVVNWACDTFEVTNCNEIEVEYDDDTFTLDVKEVAVTVTLPDRGGVRNVKLMIDPSGLYELLLWGKFSIG